MQYLNILYGCIIFQEDKKGKASEQKCVVQVSVMVEEKAKPQPLIRKLGNLQKSVSHFILACYNIY